jgi:two-component system, response regulator
MPQLTEIILVEDNMSDADLVIRSLKKNNLANNVLHLEDGQKALDYFFSEGEWAGQVKQTIPRVILLDLKMPKVNGIEVLRRLKSDEETKTIPVVILTSSKEDPDIKECYKLGVNSYVVKPVEFEDFVKAVSQLGLYWLLVNQHPKI